MLIKVKIFPGIRKEEVREKKEGVFEVRVREKPEQGKANKRLIELFAKHFQIPENYIKIIKGVKQKNKVIKIKEYGTS
jgi:hypothetical protein